MRWQDLGPGSKFLSKVPLLRVDPSTLVMPAMKKLRQEDGYQFGANLGYVERTRFIKKKKCRFNLKDVTGVGQGVARFGRGLAPHRSLQVSPTAQPTRQDAARLTWWSR